MSPIINVRYVSRGWKHSQAIKRSPRFDDWQARRKPSARLSIQPDLTKGWLELAEKAWGQCDIGLKFLRIGRYSDEAIQQQLCDHWKAGYVRALQDVKNEREKMERNRYVESLGTMSIQEAAMISHVYDND
jgi:hypothetical protein